MRFRASRPPSGRSARCGCGPTGGTTWPVVEDHSVPAAATISSVAETTRRVPAGGSRRPVRRGKPWRSPNFPARSIGGADCALVGSGAPDGGHIESRDSCPPRYHPTASIVATSYVICPPVSPLSSISFSPTTALVHSLPYFTSSRSITLKYSLPLLPLLDPLPSNIPGPFYLFSIRYPQILPAPLTSSRSITLKYYLPLLPLLDPLPSNTPCPFHQRLNAGRRPVLGSS